MKNQILAILLVTISLNILAQEKRNFKIHTIAFYNVENLFDTIDNPNTKDDEFLPISEKKWDTYRYNYKINQLEKVFKKIIEKENENNLPDIIGLCEVENNFVVEDLLKTEIFKKHRYQIIHKQSPDGRGIDCALLVNKKFEVCNFKN